MGTRPAWHPPTAGKNLAEPGAPPAQEAFIIALQPCGVNSWWAAGTGAASHTQTELLLAKGLTRQHVRLPSVGQRGAVLWGLLQPLCKALSPSLSQRISKQGCFSCTPLLC